jgi:hypothetical protein
VLAYDSGAAARLERTSAVARVGRLAGPDDDREALLEESFGVKTYPAASVGWVPVAERIVERFVLGARPPMDPDKSEKRLRKTLARGAGSGESSTPSAPAAVDGDHRRGLFGRRR